MSFDSDRKLRRWGRVFGTLSTRTWLHLGVPELISPNLNKGKREEEKAQLNVSWHVLYSKSQVMNNWGDHSTIIARIPDTDTRYRFSRWLWSKCMFIKAAVNLLAVLADSLSVLQLAMPSLLSTSPHALCPFMSRQSRLCIELSVLIGLKKYHLQQIYFCSNQSEQHVLM